MPHTPSAPLSPMHDLAREAIIRLWPVYELRRARASTSYPTLPGVGSAAEGKNWCNVFAHRRELIRPGVSKIVMPNNDTLYSVAWLDLASGPLVIDIPDMGDRYHVLGLMDSLTNPIAHLGSRLLPGGAKSVLVSGPGETAGTPPHWAGEHVRAPSRWVWIIGRILVTSPSDLPAVHKLQDGLQIRPFGDQQNAPAQFSPDCDLGAPLDARHFSTQVNAALQEMAGDQNLNAERLPSFATLGIGAGLTPSHEQIEQLEPVLQAVRQFLETPCARRGTTHWEYLPRLGQSFGDDIHLRAHISQQYIGMVESKEAVYRMTWHDGKGQRLHGRQRYALQFAPGALPPVDAFWSLTIYESATGRLIDNPIDRYAIGDRTPGLSLDEHGGLRILISHRRPATREESNWLPAPQNDFYLCLRAYLPRADILNGLYELPPVQRLHTEEH